MSIRQAGGRPAAAATIAGRGVDLAEIGRAGPRE
jgi:hypothetical protein